MNDDSEHICEICFIPSHRHPKPRNAKLGNGRYSLHPPCCKGCSCGSGGYTAAQKKVLAVSMRNPSAPRGGVL